MSLFKNKTLMITGGTGSFGNAVLNRFLETDIGEIRIFSRDEKKQDDMRHEFQTKMPESADKIKFYIGDVRNIQSIKNYSVVFATDNNRHIINQSFKHQYSFAPYNRNSNLFSVIYNFRLAFWCEYL